jgi:flagella basal body P-ring formation protein FlgA
MPRPRLLPVLALLAALLPAGVAGGERQSLDAIRDAVEQYVRAALPASVGTLEVEVGYLDSRLRLAPCEGPFDLSVPGSRSPEVGNVTVGVRCPGPTPWSLYVPVQVAAHDDVVVLASPVARGEVITADMLRVERRDVSDLIGEYYRDPEAVTGKRAGQTLPPGRVLSRLWLSAPLALRRGQEVTLLAGSGGFQVRRAGKALADGAVGERIRVENLSSRRVVEGTVTARGHVRVGL